MLRDGPIPRFVHGILEYALGVLFIAAPFLFDFNSGAATGMSVAVGVLILILAAVSDGPVSLVNQLPLILHVAVIYLLSIFLIAAPFILGFASEVAPRNFFIISGVLLLLITIGTRFRRSEPEPAAARTRTPGPRPDDRSRTGSGPNTPPPGSIPAAPAPIPPMPAQPPLSPQEQARRGVGPPSAPGTAPPGTYPPGTYPPGTDPPGARPVAGSPGNAPPPPATE